MIRQLNVDTVRKLRSTQVVVDLCSVVKELVENAIDAGAGNVRITIRSCFEIEVVSIFTFLIVFCIFAQI